MTTALHTARTSLRLGTNGGRIRRVPIVAVLVGAVLIGATATPAFAERERVNAARNVTTYDSIGAFCTIAVDDFQDMDIDVYCAADGRTWFKVRVTGVTGRVTRVIAEGEGNCSGKRVSFRDRGDVVIVKVTNVGEFLCHYSTIIVRHTG